MASMVGEGGVALEEGVGGRVHKPGLLVALIRTPALFDLAAALAEAPFRDVDYLEGADGSRAFKDIWAEGGGATLKSAPYYVLVSFIFVLHLYDLIAKQSLRSTKAPKKNTEETENMLKLS